MTNMRIADILFLKNEVRRNADTGNQQSVLEGAVMLFAMYYDEDDDETYEGAAALYEQK